MPLLTAHQQGCVPQNVRLDELLPAAAALHALLHRMNVVSPQSNVTLTVGDVVEVAEMVPRV